ncbi:MAG: hypothetical protein J3K34DRAFT_406472 [Monoraphidium minutum]|nr:MAG: hypothetical protein J3K34DRAFT_406472 [Monoraphidium minutum]
MVMGGCAGWLLALAPRGAAGAHLFDAVVVFVVACAPLDAVKLAACYRHPSWAPLAELPALLAHWALLLAGARRHFDQCGASPLGCWHLGATSLMLGGCGIALYSLRFQAASVVAGCSRALGAPIRLRDIPPLLLGRDPHPAAAATERAPPAGSKADAGAGGATARRVVIAGGGTAAVTVELLLPEAWGQSQDERDAAAPQDAVAKRQRADRRQPSADLACSGAGGVRARACKAAAAAAASPPSPQQAPLSPHRRRWSQPASMVDV